MVAEEVRKLAEESERATKQIAALIGDIQSDTDKAVISMKDGTCEVTIGTEVVNQAGQAFKEIAGLVDQVSHGVQEISAAINQMAQNSGQIVGSIKEIEQASKAITIEIQTVSAATEEQSASMEEIAAFSMRLAQMAQEMENAARNFKV